MSGKIDLSLLKAARLEFAEKLMPTLSGGNRYTGAMLLRSLDVLLAQAECETAPEEMLERAGYGNAAALATELRHRKTGRTPELDAALRSFVEAKLKLSNPKFLMATQSGPEGARS